MSIISITPYDPNQPNQMDRDAFAQNIANSMSSALGQGSSLSGSTPVQQQAKSVLDDQMLQDYAKKIALAKYKSAADMAPIIGDLQTSNLQQAIKDQADTRAQYEALKQSGAARLAARNAQILQESQPRPGFENAAKDLGWSLFGGAIGTRRINPDTGLMENSAPANWGEGAGNMAKSINVAIRNAGSVRVEIIY